MKMKMVSYPIPRRRHTMIGGDKVEVLDAKDICGYHLSPIPKGVFGKFSKIEEEFCELKDSIQQDNKVMTLVELSDLLGAIEGYIEAEYSGAITIDDLRRMSLTTKRAFQSGARK